MNNGRHKKARSERIKERQRVKRNESKKKNAHLAKEKLNHRVNLIQAKKDEMIKVYMDQIVKQFESQQQK
jgi:hypothetical protein